MYVASLYKARGVSNKQPVCAICVDRTRGKTVKVEFGYGVVVWLCAGHASVDFLAARGGRDAVLTLMRVWQAHGCYTVARQRALDAHLAALRGPRPRRRAGSYAWPAVRLRAEQLFASGVALASVTQRVADADYGVGTPPSPRTVRRWHADRRWLTHPPRAPA
jgi:hypothetical protein